MLAQTITSHVAYVRDLTMDFAHAEAPWKSGPNDWKNVASILEPFTEMIFLRIHIDLEVIFTTIQRY